MAQAVQETCATPRGVLSDVLQSIIYSCSSIQCLCSLGNEEGSHALCTAGVSPPQEHMTFAGQLTYLLFQAKVTWVALLFCLSHAFLLS